MKLTQFQGDQASIVGGAINFVKELEQLLQFLQSHKQKQSTHSKLFTNFFTYPQYSTSSPSQQHHRTTTALADVDCMAEKPSRLADIEVTMAETHANIKLLTRRRPKQLLTLVTGFHSLSLTILHLNITSTVDHMVLFSFSVKVCGISLTCFFFFFLLCFFSNTWYIYASLLSLLSNPNCF